MRVPARALGQALERFGHLQPHEQRFVTHLLESLESGVIPTPTLLNAWLGRRKSNNLGGRLSTIRIAVFEAAGLKKQPWFNGHWVWPR